MGYKEDDKAAFLQSGRCDQVRLIREVEVHDNFSFGEDSSCDSHTDKSVRSESETENENVSATSTQTSSEGSDQDIGVPKKTYGCT